MPQERTACFEYTLKCSAKRKVGERINSIDSLSSPTDLTVNVNACKILCAQIQFSCCHVTYGTPAMVLERELFRVYRGRMNLNIRILEKYLINNN